VVREPTAIYGKKRIPHFLEEKKKRDRRERPAKADFVTFSFLPQRRRIKSKRGNVKKEKDKREGIYTVCIQYAYACVNCACKVNAKGGRRATRKNKRCDNPMKKCVQYEGFELEMSGSIRNQTLRKEGKIVVQR